MAAGIKAAEYAPVIDGHRNRDAIYLVALGLALSVLVALLLSAFDYFTRGG